MISSALKFSFHSLCVLLCPPIKITFAAYLSLIFSSSAALSLPSCCCSHCLCCSLWWLLCGAASGGQSCCILALWVCRFSSLGGLGWIVWCHRQVWAPLEPRIPGVQPHRALEGRVKIYIRCASTLKVMIVLREMSFLREFLLPFSFSAVPDWSPATHMVWRCLAGHSCTQLEIGSFFSHLLSKSFMLIQNNLGRILAQVRALKVEKQMLRKSPH